MYRQGLFYFVVIRKGAIISFMDVSFVIFLISLIIGVPCVLVGLIGGLLVATKTKKLDRRYLLLGVSGLVVCLVGYAYLVLTFHL